MSVGLLAFVPDQSLTSVATATTPILRITNGTTAIFSTNATDQKLLQKAQVIATDYRCFQSPGTGLYPLVRFSKKQGGNTRYTYGAGTREALLKQDGWSVDATLGYVALAPFDGSISMTILDLVTPQGQLSHSLIGLPAISWGQAAAVAFLVLHGVPPEMAVGGVAAASAAADELYHPESENEYPSAFFALQRNPSATTATVWLAQFSRTAPGSGVLSYRDAAGPQQVTVTASAWTSQISDQNAYRCFYQEIALKNLVANSRQEVQFADPNGQLLATCEVVTLPTSLSPIAPIVTLQATPTAVNLPQNFSFERNASFAGAATNPEWASATLLAIRDASTAGSVSPRGLLRRAPPSRRLVRPVRRGLVTMLGGTPARASANAVVSGRRDLTRLPGSLLSAIQRLHNTSGPLTIFLGSCFSYLHEHGHVATAYEKLYWTHGIHPQINFWMGDQVYLDAPWHEYQVPYSTDELRTKFTNRYLMSWSLMRSLHRQAANVFVSDDHEFHNDYPGPSFIAPLQDSTYMGTWQSIAQKLFKDMQSRNAIMTFNLGQDLSFFVLDARVNRTATDFMTQNDMQAFKTWIRGLASPGVIVCSQPIFAKTGEQEKNLTDYAQFVELSAELWVAKHDILFLSGDVHFGRVASAPLQTGKTLYEAISSPLSLVEDEAGNLSNFLAKSRWRIGQDTQPINFPQVMVPNVTGAPIKYIQAVSPKLDDPARTAENFMTIRFEKLSSGGVNAAITAWLPRRNPEAATLYRDYSLSITLS